MTTRKELRENVKLLEKLEQLESLQDSPMGMQITGYYNASFDITGKYTGEPTLHSQLDSIARTHFKAMIAEQITFVKQNITIELQDKDKQPCEA